MQSMHAAGAAPQALPGLYERLAVLSPCVILRVGGAAGAAHAPATAPAGQAAPVHRALSEDAALDVFVESLAHEQALDSDAAPAPAVAAPAGGAHAAASIVSYPARRLLTAKAAAVKPPAAAAKAHAAAAKAPADAPARDAPAAKPLASAEAPVNAPFGEPAPAAQPARRALSEAPAGDAEPAEAAPAKQPAATAAAGQVAPEPLRLPDGLAEITRAELAAVVGSHMLAGGALA